MLERPQKRNPHENPQEKFPNIREKNRPEARKSEGGEATIPVLRRIIAMSVREAVVEVGAVSGGDVVKEVVAGVGVEAVINQ